MRRSPAYISQCAVIAVFATVLFGLGGAYLALADREASSIELRELTAAPRPSRSGLMDGGYFRGWDKYLSDQIPLREWWLRAYGAFSVRVLGKQKMNHVYVGTDGYLLNAPELPPGPRTASDIASATARFRALDSFIESYGGRFVYLHVPHKQMIVREHYPSYVVWPKGYDEVDEAIVASFRRAGVPIIDLRTIFLERRSRQQLFYRTDHHWTFEGAYLAYTELVRHFGLVPYSRDRLDVVTLPNPYIGSQNRRVGMAVSTRDKLTFARPRVPVPYTLTVPGKDPAPMIALPPDVETPVRYSALMGGDLGEIVIETHRPRLPDLLIVGSSFTNAVEPLLYLDFDETRILDLRAFKSMSLYDYIALHRPDCVVLMVSGHEVLTDTGNMHFGALTVRSAPATGSATPCPRGGDGVP